MKKTIIILFLCSLCSCSLIDDDLSDCGVDFYLQYQMQLETNMQLELQTVLNAETDDEIRNDLEHWLKPIFTDRAKDIDLSFYAVNQYDELSHHLKEIINDNRTSFTFYLPKENYMHLAVANIDDNRQVQLLGKEHSKTMSIKCIDKDTVESFDTGVFTARLLMQVTDTANQVFDVNLYMANAAVVLVIDHQDCDFQYLNCVLKGTADEFLLSDSTFLFNEHNVVRMTQVPRQNKNIPAVIKQQPTTTCLAAVAFPSADIPQADGSFFTIENITTIAQNKHTTTTITVDVPLTAGSISVIKCKMKKDGSLQPENSTQAGATVQLDWKDGTEHDIEM